jgi:hypothetical protein
MIRALEYLHNTGHVVLLDRSTVCTNPSVIPKISAKFISSQELRSRQAVTLVSDKHINCMLDIHDAHDEQLAKEKDLILKMEMCYEILSTRDTSKLYLFPSLAAFKRMCELLGNKPTIR